MVLETRVIFVENFLGSRRQMQSTSCSSQDQAPPSSVAQIRVPEEHLWSQSLDPSSSLDYFQITLSWAQSDRLPVPPRNRWDGTHWTLHLLEMWQQRGPKCYKKMSFFVCMGKVSWAEAEVQVLLQSNNSRRTGKRAVAACWRHGLSWGITQQGFCLHPHKGILPSDGWVCKMKGWVCELRSSECQRGRNGFGDPRSFPNGPPSITTPSNSAKYQN